MTTSDQFRTAFLNAAEVFPQDQSQFLIKITDVYTKTANAVNVRQIGLYQEGNAQVTGQQFTTISNSTVTKYTYRKLFYFGAIATNASLNIPHGVTGLVQLTHLYGTCITDVVDYRPIPFTSRLNVTNQITIRVFNDPILGRNILIENGATAPNITSGIVVMEYLLN